MTRSAILSILKNASLGVRESASCIVAQKIRDKQKCSYGIYDYRLLFVMRDSKQRSWPSTLTFPGGVVDSDDGLEQLTSISPLSESPPTDLEMLYRETAVRELVEETKFPNPINLRSLIPWSIWQTPLSFKRRYNAVFYFHFVSGEEFLPLEPSEGEIESLHWFSPAEVLLDSSKTIAPVQVSDVGRCYQMKTFEELQKFASKRHQNHETEQCMPVLAIFADGACAIHTQDSFYETALQMQILDTSRMIKVEGTISENSAVQEVVCRTVMDGQGNRSMVTSEIWQGHLAGTTGFKSVVNDA